MKNTLTALIHQALIKVAETFNFEPQPSKIVVTPTKQREHGDYACNIALISAKQAKTNPKVLAQKIIDQINNPKLIAKMEIAGPGFINFFLKNDAQFSVVHQIINEQENYGQLNIGKNLKVNVEYVSANPTGPLHVGHGRGAAIGSALVNILKKAGYSVTREYYINDAGRQMDILATSIWLRYLEICKQKIIFPSNGYKGQYIYTIAHQIFKQYKEKFLKSFNEIYINLPQDFDPKTETGNKETHIDALISKAKTLLGNGYQVIHKMGLTCILDDIKSDLKNFNVEFDNWFPESTLMASNEVKNAIKTLKDKNYIYEKDKALWFKSTAFNDEKDRCIVRDNGQSTYFASDAAYLKNKFERGFDKVIYLFGADHHGYIARLLALANSFGYDTNNIHISLVQFASLFRNGKPVQMSTRSGSFVTLRELREEVGTDAARFFYIMRKSDQHLDFDLDLATSKSNENPVYYIQYAHARIASIFRQLNHKDLNHNPEIGLNNLVLLNSEIELSIANKLSQYPNIIETSAAKLEAHLVANYLKELANLLHTYYNSERFILEDLNLMQARLTLLLAIKHTIVSALNVLGISSPDKM